LGVRSHMVIDRSKVNRILVITLSNVGDIILTTPVIQRLKKEFPGARLDLMVGPRGKEIFERDPAIFKLLIYDKHMSIAAKRRLQLKLKRLHYDFVVDLRNTIFPLLIGPKYRTGTIQRFPKEIVRKSQRHLYRLEPFGMGYLDEPSYIHIPEDEDERVLAMLKESKIGDPVVVINPGAKSHLKRWRGEGFARVAERLMEECGTEVVFVGAGEDALIVDAVMRKMGRRAHNFVGRTNIRQLAALLKRARLLITNDSAPLHLACAVGTKTLALFGPTDPKKYGPTGEFDIVINKKLVCSPCESAVCRNNLECMALITPEEVFETAKEMLEGYE